MTARTAGLSTYGSMPKPGSTYGRSGNLAETTLAETETGQPAECHYGGSFGAVTKAVAEIRSASNLVLRPIAYFIYMHVNLWRDYSHFWTYL